MNHLQMVSKWEKKAWIVRSQFPNVDFILYGPSS